MSQNQNGFQLYLRGSGDKVETMMNHVERFRATMNFQSVDRLPKWEWAMWWDKTIERWHGEGLPSELQPARGTRTVE